MIHAHKAGDHERKNKPETKKKKKNIKHVKMRSMRIENFLPNNGWPKKSTQKKNLTSCHERKLQNRINGLWFA